jgi:hypothetical protein
MRFRPENVKKCEEEKKQEVKEYGSRRKGFERDNILALLSRVKNKKILRRGRGSGVQTGLPYIIGCHAADCITDTGGIDLSTKCPETVNQTPHQVTRRGVCAHINQLQTKNLTLLFSVLVF